MPQFKETRAGENVEHDNLKTPDWLLFARAWKTALRRYKLWGATWLFVLLLSFVPALVTGAAFDDMVGDRYPTSDAARDLHSSMAAPSVGLSAVFRQDFAGPLAQLETTQAALVAGLGLIALLFGAFAAGGWLQVIFEQPHRQTLRRFGFGGARYFGRFLRIMVMVALAIAFHRWLFFGDPWKHVVLGGILEVPEYDWGSLETLESERQVVHLAWIQNGLFAISFVKVMAWAIYTRTRMALRDSRSAIGAGFASGFMMLRHPIQTLRPLALLLIVELLVVAVFLGWWQGTVEDRFLADANGWHVAAMFGIGQIAAIWRQITRGAYYHAAGRVSQSLVRPTERHPNPWEETIGGPGGPQYPVVDDGYHVAV